MMKKYLLVSALALGLGACSGIKSTASMLGIGGDDAAKDKVTQVSQNNDVQSLLTQAQQAYQSGNKIAAIQAWEAAANQGNAAAQHNLSVVYRTGDGIAQNPQMAMNWLTKSAQQGYVPALYDMGSYYLSQGDAVKAAPLIQAAAEKGYAPAQFNLGVMLVRGDGVAKNQQQGVELIKKAAAQGFAPAQQALKGK